MSSNPRVVYIENLKQAKEEIRKIGSDVQSIGIMAPKGVFRAIKIRGISSKAANIIKQEMLSKGGEAAVPWSAVDLAPGDSEVLIMGTLKQFEGLIYKLRMQPFGLKEVAGEIQEVLENLEDEKHKVIRAGKYKLPVGERTYVMGILNITPDSFSDGGRYNEKDMAVKRALEMAEEGADIIDIGGESTRPGAEPVHLDEELNRVMPVLEAVAKEVDLPISIDTYKARVAEEAIKAGAHIINDIWGLKFDPEMAEVAAKYDVPVIIMHNKKDREYKDLISEIILSLRESMKIGEKAGVQKENIIIDPGIGFGKTTEHNLEVLRRLKEFKCLGRPILLGTSRKSVIGNTLNLPVGERLEGTAATVALGIAGGADIVRVHDVKEMVRVARMTDAVVRI